MTVARVAPRNDNGTYFSLDNNPAFTMGGVEKRVHESAIELERPRPYRIEVPVSVLAATDIEVGSAPALRLEIHDGYPRLVCEPAGSGRALTRTVSARAGEERPGLTLPEQCVEAGGFHGAHAVPYSRPCDDRLYVGFGRQSRLDGVDLTARSEAFVSRRQNGDLAVSLDEQVAGPLASASTLRFSLDHYGGQVFFLLDVAAELAPDGAIEITANPNTGRESTAGLSVLFPRVIGRLCGVAGSVIRWGRTASGNRILGTLSGGGA